MVLLIINLQRSNYITRIQHSTPSEEELNQSFTKISACFQSAGNFFRNKYDGLELFCKTTDTKVPQMSKKE